MSSLQTKQIFEKMLDMEDDELETELIDVHL